jgi:hypothetical protein
VGCAHSTHEPTVERVTRDRDAVGREHVGGVEAASGHPHRGEVRRATAEVGDQHDALLLEVRGEVVRGGDRLGAEAHVGEASDARGAAEALLRERVVGRIVREAGRTTEHDARDVGVEVLVRAHADHAEERADQVLEGEGSTPDLRLGERPRREVALDRPDQAAAEAVLHQGAGRARAEGRLVVREKEEGAPKDGGVGCVGIERCRWEELPAARGGAEGVARTEVDGVDGHSKEPPRPLPATKEVAPSRVPAARDARP